MHAIRWQHFGSLQTYEEKWEQQPFEPHEAILHGRAEPLANESLDTILGRYREHVAR